MYMVDSGAFLHVMVESSLYAEKRISKTKDYRENPTSNGIVRFTGEVKVYIQGLVRPNSRKVRRLHMLH